MSRAEIENELIRNLSGLSVLMNFGYEGSPSTATDEAKAWLDAAAEIIQAMVISGMNVRMAIDHVSRLTELSRNLKPT